MAQEKRVAVENEKWKNVEAKRERVDMKILAGLANLEMQAAATATKLSNAFQCDRLIVSATYHRRFSAHPHLLTIFRWGENRAQFSVSYGFFFLLTINKNWSQFSIIVNDAAEWRKKRSFLIDSSIKWGLFFIKINKQKTDTKVKWSNWNGCNQHELKLIERNEIRIAYEDITIYEMVM